MRPKRERTKRAKAEVWLYLAVSAQRWADDVADKGGARPFAEWPDDDPLRTICRELDLTPAELSKIIDGIAQQAEDRAMYYGFGEGPTLEDWRDS